MDRMIRLQLIFVSWTEIVSFRRSILRKESIRDTSENKNGWNSDICNNLIKNQYDVIYLWVVPDCNICLARIMPVHQLFGGSMSISLPAFAVDVSTLRDIPDNQEVFVHSTTDQSIIVEILQYLDEGDEQAVRSHFDSLASDNECEPDNYEVKSIEQLQDITMHQCQSAYSLVGMQRVAKFHESAENEVNVYMGLFRLPQHQADVVVTFNDPHFISPDSSSHSSTDEPTGDQRWTFEQFKESLSSVNLLNPGLFG
ncbi:Ran guanine nucleotide release factor [Lamellibrachia satsuma]|nr:Ran guanine nucleotide release factor [Lamellibrachia satsuma]